MFVYVMLHDVKADSLDSKEFCRAWHEFSRHQVQDLFFHSIIRSQISLSTAFHNIAKAV